MVSLIENEKPPLGPTVSLFPTNDFYANVMPSSIVNERAKDYDFAMGQQSQGRTYYADAINLGRENLERQRASVNEAIGLQQKRTALLNEYLKSRDNSKPLGEDEYNMINTLTSNDFKSMQTNPETFFEKKFGRVAVEKASITEYEAEDPDGSKIMRDAAADVVAKQQKARRLYEELENEYSKQGFGSKALAWTQQIVPFYSLFFKQYDALEDAKTSRFLPGNNKEDQYNWFYQSDLDTSWPAVESAVREMFADSPLDGLAYLQGMLGYSATSRFLDNAIGVGDLAMLAPGGGLIPLAAAKGAAKATAAGVMKQVVRSGLTKSIPEGSIEHAGGSVAEVGIKQAYTKLVERTGATHQAVDFDDLIGEVPLILNPEGVLGRGVNSTSTQTTQRLVTALQSRAERLLGTLTEPLVIERLGASQAALEAATRAARASFDIEYPAAVDHIIEVAPLAGRDTAFNLDAISVQIGNREALPFSTQGAATNFARNMLMLPESSYKVLKTGDKQFVINHVKYVDETLPQVRDLLIPTDQPTPVNMKNMLFGFLRTPEDTMPKDVMDAMKVATYGSSALLKLTQDIAKDIGKLGVKKRKLGEFLDYQRDFIDADGVRGWNSNTVGEFEKDWFTKYGEVPTDGETSAYFAFRQLHDYDYIVRNIGMYRDRVRQGLQSHIVRFNAEVPKISRRGLIEKHIQSEPVMGKTIQQIPWDEPRDVGIGILNDKTGEIEYLRKNIEGSTQAGRDGINNLTREGYKLIQLDHQNGWEVLKNTPGIKGPQRGSIHFLFVKRVETKPLSFKQLPYKAGSHVENKPGWYVSSPNVERHKGTDGIYRHTYYGDANILHFMTEKQAKFWQGIMEQGRLLVREGNVDRLRAFVEGQTPYSFDKFMQMWKTDTNPNGLLDPEATVRVRKSDTTLAQGYKLSDEYQNFEDFRDSPYNMQRGVNLEYAAERGSPLNTVATQGTPEAPIYRLEPAQMVDSLSLLHRNTSQLLKTRYLDDLKIKASERFVQEFGDVIDAPLDELRADPTRALFLNKWRPGVPQEKLIAAKNYRRSVVEFLGLKNDFQKSIDVLKHKAYESIYGVTGGRVPKLVEDYLLHKVADPAHKLRSFAFHTKLGLFAPMQMFLQAQTMAHVAALEGMGNTSRAMAASTMFSFLRYGDDAASLKKAAQVATKMGWKADEFIESYQAYRQSGMYVVGVEHGLRDDILDPKVFRGAFGTFLDKGTLFFNMGERGTRNVAWNAAYLRWRAANPGRKFDNAAKTEVLSRADLLSVNMSRASNASWQRGFMAIPTQFMAYQTRLMEQLLSKRLTKTEKLKATMMYSAMYGMPVAGGAWMGGFWNPGEDVRRYFQERGIDYDESLIKPLMDGAISLGFEWATGVKYNFPERYGPGGLTWLREIREGDKTLLDTLLGVSGSVMGDVTLSPFVQYFLAPFTGRWEEFYTPSWNDVVRVAKNISSVNAGFDAFTAIHIGKMMNKRGDAVDDVTTFDGIMKSLGGVIPDDIQQMYRDTAIKKRRVEWQATNRRMAIENIRAAFKAGEDKSTFDHYYNAYALHLKWGEFTPEQISSILRDATKGHETQFEEMIRKGLENPELQEYYIKQMEKRNKRLGR